MALLRFGGGCIPSPLYSLHSTITETRVSQIPGTPEQEKEDRGSKGTTTPALAAAATSAQHRRATRTRDEPRRVCSLEAPARVNVTTTKLYTPTPASHIGPPEHLLVDYAAVPCTQGRSP